MQQLQSPVLLLLGYSWALTRTSPNGMGVALSKGIAFFEKCPIGPPFVFALTLGVVAICPSECQHLARGHPVPVGHIPAMASDAEAALGLCRAL